MTRLALALLLLSITGCASAPAEVPVKKDVLEAQARETLDALHAAAAAADGPRYWALYAPDAVFLGTDATERWTLAQFKAYAEPHFSKGKGWTYEATERHVDVAPDGSYAWFDELLDNAKLGQCRGTGVLRREGPPAEGGSWRFVQYHLTIPVPNDLAEAVAKQVRALNEKD